jgi:hypothetical protein
MTRVGLVLSALFLAAPQDANALGEDGYALGIANGVTLSKTEGTRYDLRLADFQFCDIFCLRVTPARFRTGGSGGTDENQRHLRVNAAGDFDLASLDPGGKAGGAPYSWSFLNAGLGLDPFDDEGFIIPYYQAEWWTTNGTQYRHIVGLEAGIIGGGGFSFNVEWEKQGEHQAVNINLLLALGYIGI